MSFKEDVEKVCADIRLLLIFCLSFTLILSLLLGISSFTDLFTLFIGTMIFPSIVLIQSSKTLDFTLAGWFIAFGFAFGSPFLFAASILLKKNVFTDIIEGLDHFYEKL